HDPGVVPTFGRKSSGTATTLLIQNVACLESGAVGMPGGALLVGVGNFQDCAFAHRFSQKLESDREFGRARKATRDADSADPGEVAGDRKNIRKVHLERVTGFFTGLKGSGRRGGSDDGINLLKGVDEIVSNERSDFLGAQVVGVVVATAKNVGAENDAA